MWMESLDLVLDRLAENMPVPLNHIRGISGSCQQHGSVFWNGHVTETLHHLDPRLPLVAQLPQALAHQWSPNWQDQSTQEECDAFDAALGDRQKLSEATGSGAHHVSLNIIIELLPHQHKLTCTSSASLAPRSCA